MSAKQKPQSARIAARYVAILCDVIRSRDVNPLPLLDAVGLSIASTEDRDAWFCSDKVDQLISLAMEETGRLDLGFDLGCRIKLTSHDLLGFGMISATNHHEMMRILSRHFHLINEVFSCRYIRTAEYGEIYYSPIKALDSDLLRFYYEVFATGHYAQILFTSGPVAYDIYLPMAAPAHVHRYEDLAPARFHFEESGIPGVRIVMRGELLDRELPFADQRAHKEIDEKCTALAPRPIGSPKDLGEYIRMMLRESIGEKLTLADLAVRLKTSKRTIDRYLAKQNLSFRDLSEEVRFERACELLREPGATIEFVSCQLGFDYPANFSRAFRRVMGFSPTEYQKQDNTCL